MPAPEDHGDGSLWTEIRRISENLVMINTKLDDLAPRLNDHETRIRKLEERRFPLQQIGAIVGLLSLLIAIVAMVVTLK